VKLRIVLILAALSPLFLGGCWNGRVLFAFERPYWASLHGGHRLALSLDGASLSRGFLPRIVVRGQAEKPAERLAAEAAAGGYRAIVVGPLLSFDWLVFAPRNERTRFILLGGVAAADLPPNTVALQYDRRAAFRAAGAAAGLVVRQAPEGGSRIAVLLSPSAAVSPAEADAFSEGAAKALDGSRPVVRTLGEKLDKPAVKTAIEEMRREGVEVFLLGMGPLDAYALEVLKGAGGSAVVGDWARSGAFPGQVLLSVEEDLAAGVAIALGSRRDARTVRGPVRLVSGKARVLPPGMLSAGEGE
jgi:hypothetical protein